MFPAYSALIFIVLTAAPSAPPLLISCKLMQVLCSLGSAAWFTRLAVRYLHVSMEQMYQRVEYLAESPPLCRRDNNLQQAGTQAEIGEIRLHQDETSVSVWHSSASSKSKNTSIALGAKTVGHS